MLLLVPVMFIALPQLSLALAKGGYSSPRLSNTIAVLEKCNGVLMYTFVYAYVAFFGSCIASFLNVVAWRVPRGRSILGSSHCPACDHKLSMRDNIPIWGWLKNEGRCRHCRAPIAQRYLCVEILFGGVFLVLFLAETIFGGFNLPTAPDLYRKGIELVFFTPNAQLVQTFAFHATLMSILFTVAVISSESFRIPLSFIAIAGVILFGIACLCPVVLQVSWQAFPTDPANETLVPFRINSLLTMLLGSAAGIAAGIIGALAPGSGEAATRPIVRQQLIVSFALVGLALGWQSVVVTMLIWLALTTAGRLVTRSAPGSPFVMPAALLHILSWSLIFGR